MARAENLPRVSAADGKTIPDRTLKLSDLRDIVEMSALLPADSIVRVTSIPFHMADLGNPKGGRAMTLALDVPDGPPRAPHYGGRDEDGM